MEQSKLEQEIKELIVESLELEDIKPEEIKTEEPLFVDGLGLDSIDALELGIAVKKKYDVSLKKDDDKDNKKHFYSVKTLADFIKSQKNKD